jgi:hypothetical protein
MRRTMLAAAAAFTAAALALATGTAAQATTNGLNKVASITISYDGSYVVGDIHYDVRYCDSNGVCTIGIDYVTFNVNPGENLDAYCLDVEMFDGNYAQVKCAGSSSTQSSANYNDIPAAPGTFSVTGLWDNDGSSHGQTIAVTNSPQWRIRSYGLNNHHGSDQRHDGYKTIA